MDSLLYRMETAIEERETVKAYQRQRTEPRTRTGERVLGPDFEVDQTSALNQMRRALSYLLPTAPSEISQDLSTTEHRLGSRPAPTNMPNSAPTFAEDEPPASRFDTPTPPALELFQYHTAFTLLWPIPHSLRLAATASRTSGDLFETLLYTRALWLPVLFIINGI